MPTPPYDKTFVDGLIYFAYEETTDEKIVELRNKAWKQLMTSAANGGGEFSIVSANLQGKSFQFQVERSAGQLFAECQQAIRQFREGTVTVAQTSWWSYWDLY